VDENGRGNSSHAVTAKAKKIMINPAALRLIRGWIGFSEDDDNWSPKAQI
jgi:hypothetical protein